VLSGTGLSLSAPLALAEARAPALEGPLEFQIATDRSSVAAAQVTVVQRGACCGPDARGGVRLTGTKGTGTAGWVDAAGFAVNV
jgi:hypothetical protein